jgi:hypothetical protein
LFEDRSFPFKLSNKPLLFLVVEVVVGVPDKDIEDASSDFIETQWFILTFGDIIRDSNAQSILLSRGGDCDFCSFSSSSESEAWPGVAFDKDFSLFLLLALLLLRSFFVFGDTITFSSSFSPKD